jgi:UDP-N-acetylglucosamine 2-epimerase (non-hydrolysing)
MTSGADRRRIMLICGTRPEAIKLAPVARALEASPRFEPILTITAQHRDLLDPVLDVFGMTPDHDLDVHASGQTLSQITSRCLERLAPVLEAERPAAVLVQGDTLTTFAGALAAFYHQVPVIHLEAGLRTGNPQSPFPEEINRRLTSNLASLHLAPTAIARCNLMAEGCDPAMVVVTGNTVIDALLWTVEHTRRSPAVVEEHRGPVLLVTTHRRESWGAPMREVGRALADIARAQPDLLLFVAAHPNPLVREALAPHVANLANVVMSGPRDYDEFCQLMRRSTVILTDSGGIQEEGPSLGKPVLVMRDTTERPEAVTAGTVRLVGTDRLRIVQAVDELLHDQVAYGAMARAINPYGDGHATERALDAIRYFFDDGSKPADFNPGASTGTPVAATT